MPRSSVVWCNTVALERTLAHARNSGAPPEELAGVERALEAAGAAERRRFTMIIKGGLDRALDDIEAHARRPGYATRVMLRAITRADDHGCLMIEADELARVARVPLDQLYGALLDLEDPRVAVLTRIMKGRQLRGVQFARRIWHQPKVSPRRNGGPAHRAAA